MSNNKISKKHKFDEVRVRYMQKEVVSELNNIAANKGVTLSAFLKPELRKIRDSYPDEMRKPPRPD